MDTIDLGGIYAFTALDIFTKEADIMIVPGLTARFGSEFLYQSMRRRFDGWSVHLIQTDGGPEFKAEFLENIYGFCKRHRVARPYRKNEQSFMESFNRTVRRECLGWEEISSGANKGVPGYGRGLFQEVSLSSSTYGFGYDPTTH